MRTYSLTVSIRRLFAMLMAIAVLVGPVLTHASASAAAVTDHHVQMMEAGHCEASPADSSEDESAPAKSCCVSMCMGVALTPPAAADPASVPAPAVFAPPSAHLNHLAEIATPPPKFA